MTAPELVETVAPVPDPAPAAPAVPAVEPVAVEVVDPAVELARGAAAEPVNPPPPAAGDPAPVTVRSKRSGWLVVGIVLAVVAAGVLVYSIREGQRNET